MAMPARKSATINHVVVVLRGYRLLRFQQFQRVMQKRQSDESASIFTFSEIWTLSTVKTVILIYNGI